MILLPPSQLEIRIFHCLNADGGPLLDGLALALSSPAFGFAVAAALLLLGVRRLRPVALLPGLAIAIAVSDGVGSQILRSLFARRRPCYALPPTAVRWVGAASDVGSMPSLHAANFFAMAVLATAVDRRLAAPAFAIAIGVAISRVYLGVHWPGDVVAGACWGALAGGLGAVVARRGRPPSTGPAASAPRAQ